MSWEEIFVLLTRWWKQKQIGSETCRSVPVAELSRQDSHCEDCRFRFCLSAGRNAVNLWWHSEAGPRQVL
jgi:hypothetical protein